MLPSNILSQALKEVKKGTFYPYKLCAIIFKGKRIISIGINEMRYHKDLPSKFSRWKGSLHAEASAILKIGMNNVKGSSILVIKENVSGNLGMAKPCNFCREMIEFCGIKNLYYSNYNGEISYEKL